MACECGHYRNEHIDGSGRCIAYESCTCRMYMEDAS